MLTYGGDISCSINTGECDCNVEYSGSQCNECSQGHYDSDPDSSVLICEGMNYIILPIYGISIENKLLKIDCGCNHDGTMRYPGTTKSKCDDTNGICECRDGWVGVFA